MGHREISTVISLTTTRGELKRVGVGNFDLNVWLTDHILSLLSWYFIIEFFRYYTKLRIKAYIGDKKIFQQKNVLPPLRIVAGTSCVLLWCLIDFTLLFYTLFILAKSPKSKVSSCKSKGEVPHSTRPGQLCQQAIRVEYKWSQVQYQLQEIDYFVYFVLPSVSLYCQYCQYKNKEKLRWLSKTFWTVIDRYTQACKSFPCPNTSSIYGICDVP